MTFRVLGWFAYRLSFWRRPRRPVAPFSPRPDLRHLGSQFISSRFVPFIIHGDSTTVFAIFFSRSVCNQQAPQGLELFELLFRLRKRRSFAIATSHPPSRQVHRSDPDHPRCNSPRPEHRQIGLPSRARFSSLPSLQPRPIIPAMKLTDNQIKQGLIHPEVVVRNTALPYFSDSLRDDPSVMPLVTQAIETHGWDDAFTFMHHVPELTQTEDTVLWLIDQINRMGRPDTQEAANLCRTIAKILAMANVSLLMKHEQAILGLEGLPPEQQEVIADRLRLMTVDGDTLWHELEEFCEANRAKDTKAVNLDHAFRVAEAIGRDDVYADNVLALLSQDVIFVGWMGCLSARVAGEMRLEAAAPLLVAQLRDDAGDLMHEECMRAIIKMGDDSTVGAICRDWSKASSDYRFYVSTALASIHCDSVVPKCLELLQTETAAEIRRNLICAILANFSSEGIEPARRIVLKKDDDVREQLVGVAVLMGHDFPELSRWLKAETKQAEEMKQHLKEVESGGPPEMPLLPKPPSFDHLLASPQAPIGKKERVGRNDPCPCGSGKKYKKCCGRDK